MLIHTLFFIFIMISIRPLYDGTYGQLEIDADIPVLLFDHLGGFSVEQENSVLEQLTDLTTETRDVYCEYILSDKIKNKHPKLNLKFDEKLWMHGNNISSLIVPDKPKHDFQNFLCTFNSNPHNSRKLLVSILHKRGWFNSEYSTKQFAYFPYEVIGQLYDYHGRRAKSTTKFFIADDSTATTKFYRESFSFESTSLDHGFNFKCLQNSLSKSFVHLVSETIATSHYPFVTEKCFYSIANQGLFLAYAQPGWHKHLELYFGFKKYDRIFDYSFDRIVNPVDRLIALTDMLSKFSTLNRFDWHDLWLIERDTIMHNYMHFAGEQYRWHLKQKLNVFNESPVVTATNNL